MENKKMHALSCHVMFLCCPPLYRMTSKLQKCETNKDVARVIFEAGKQVDVDCSDFSCGIIIHNAS